MGSKYVCLVSLLSQWGKAICTRDDGGQLLYACSWQHVTLSSHKDMLPVQ